MKINTMKLRGLRALALKGRSLTFDSIIPLIVLALSFAVNSAWADRKSDTDRLRSAVEHGGIMEHLEALQKIANKNGGTRYVGTNGDLQTRNYIASVLTRAGLNVQRLPVNFENFHETTPAVLELVSPTSKAYVEGIPGAPTAQFHIVQSSGNGDVTANMQAVDIMDPPGPTPSSSNSGCETADFNGFVASSLDGACGIEENRSHKLLDSATLHRGYRSAKARAEARGAWMNCTLGLKNLFNNFLN
jgi:hypothetical protein